MAFEWIACGINDSFEVTFILLNPGNSILETFLMENGINVVRIHYDGKRDFLTAFFRLVYFFLKNRPAVVHTHLFDASLVGLLAAWATAIRHRIYTRHTSTFHHRYFPKGMKYDLLTNKLATKIISISQATDHVLFDLERVRQEKVIKIHHGFDLSAFASPSKDRIETVKARWNIGKTSPVVGIVARQIEWKGIQFIIPAFMKFLKLYPTAQLLLANAAGPYQSVLEDQLRLLPANSVVRIPFEQDAVALYHIMDLYVHTPVDPFCEAFGQTYVESLAAGVPSIFTLSGISAEFIVHERNALVVNFNNSEDIYVSLVRLWEDPELMAKLISNGREDVKTKFGLEKMLGALKKLYGAT